MEIIGPMREEVRGGQGKLNNEKFHNYYSPPNFLKMIESMRMRCWGM